MSVCITAGTVATHLAVSAFTLSWMHSVERTQWEEDWRIIKGKLELVQARVKGSGAGMEPADDAMLKNGWWHYVPNVPLLKRLHLADANESFARWRICSEGGCRDLPLGTTHQSIVITPCSSDALEPTK